MIHNIYVAKSYSLKVNDHQSFGCRFPTGSKNATVFWGRGPPHPACLFRIPTRHFLVKRRLAQAIFWFERSTCGPEQKKGQKDRKMDNALKRQKCYISRTYQEVPWQPIAPKIYTWSNCTDVIACAKFGDNRFLGSSLPAVKNPPFQNSGGY